MEKIKDEIVLDLSLIDKVRKVALKMTANAKLSNQMRQMYGSLSSACANILALDYIEKLDK